MFDRCYRNSRQYLLLKADEQELQNGPYPSKWYSVVVKFWFISGILIGCIFLVDFFELGSITRRSMEMLKDLQKLPQLPTSLNGYLINTPGCRIPDMDPFESSVKQYISTPSKIICNHNIPPLFESNLTSLYMITKHLPLYNIRTNSSSLNCCYQYFTRKEPTTNSQSDRYVTYSKKCVQITSTVTRIDGEFIRVVCKNVSQTLVYEDYFSFIPVKRTYKEDHDSKVNILIIGLDGVSRINLHRQLPVTHKYLKDELGAIELLGYNKVADNTYPNLIPVLTGMSQKEMEEYCNPKSEKHFDACPFLWKNYSAKNYVTAIGEDCAWIGLFNYLKIGFKKQPSDYYFTSFNGVAESNIGNYDGGNCKHCIGGRESYKVTLDYISKFTLRMHIERTPYFGFFWGNSLSHDNLNRPALGDKNYYELFKELNEDGRLNNTITVFMSDHGIRWGSIRETYQGQMEERLPFVIFILPKWFQEIYLQATMNLNQNVRRLTSPFDLYETLKELLEPGNLDSNIERNDLSRGYSLFNEIPKNRTCESAEIVSHWCTCQQSIEIAINDTRVISAANYAVNNINRQLQGYADCVPLTLSEIINARVLTHDAEHITNKRSIKDYTVTLKTVPGDGIFEVTIRSKEGKSEAQKKAKEYLVEFVEKFQHYGHNK